MRFVTLTLTALVLASGAWARDSDGPFYLQPFPIVLSTPNPLKASTSSNRVTLTWSNINGETGFFVERRTSGNQFTVIGKTTTNVTTYTDTATTSSVYQYRVRAYSAVSGGMTYSRYTNTTYTNTATSTTGSTSTSTTGSTATSTTGSTTGSTPTSTTGSTATSTTGCPSL